MASILRCPLDPRLIYYQKSRMDLNYLKEIDEHFTSTVKMDGCSHPPALKDLVYTESCLIGCTPLILACHFGQLDSVMHLVENWKVNILSAAPYDLDPFNSTYGGGIFNYNFIDRATPLFVAASNGHIEIVRYLVGKGADVSAKTYSLKTQHLDGLTPLYGVLCVLGFDDKHVLARNRMNDSRISIVRFLLESGADPSSPSLRPSSGYPIWKMRYCDIAAVTELINHGMGLNQREPLRNGTVLQYWSSGRPNFFHKEANSLSIVKLLLTKGADLLAQDDRGFTCLLQAASTGKFKYFNLEVLDYLLEKDELSRVEKIDAMELAGAILLRKSKRARSRTLRYWSKALQLRQMETENPIEKNLLSFKIGLSVEWTDLAQLEHVVQHRSEHMIQSFLVSWRICSEKGWLAIYHLFHSYIIDEGCFHQLEHHGRFVEILHILWAMMETLLRLDSGEKRLREKRWMADALVRKLVDTLSLIKTTSPELWSVETIKTSLELVAAMDLIPLAEIDHNYPMYFHYSDYIANVLFQLIKMLADQPMFNEDSMKSLIQLISRDRRNGNGRNLLHIVLLDHQINDNNLYAIIRLLLQARIDPNAIDKDGNAPLHFADRRLAKYKDFTITARLLLDFGAQMNRKNAVGKTALDSWIDNYNIRKGNSWYDGDQVGIGDPAQFDWCHVLPTLSVLSARVIRCYKVPYKRLPAGLIPLIELHKLSF